MSLDQHHGVDLSLHSADCRNSAGRCSGGPHVGGKDNYGFDAGRKEYDDLVEAGIIDPIKVVRIALENSVSVASFLLLTEATMTEIPELSKERASDQNLPCRMFCLVSSRFGAWLGAIALYCVLSAQASPAWGQQIVYDQFDHFDEGVWCPCQIERSRLLFLEEQGSHFARITITEDDLGGNLCRKSECNQRQRLESSVLAGSLFANQLSDPADILPERLGSSLVAPPTGRYPEGGPYCTPAKRAEGLAKNEDTDTPCAQRQELRFQNGKMQPAEVPLLYSFRFRMPKHVSDTTGSVRRVTAQWKQEPAVQPPLVLGKTWGPSPFLAQRFDDGILNITVQDGECRCLVAAAAHETNPKWTEKPQRCFSVREGAQADEQCSADLKTEYGENPLLPSARGEWVVLRYLVKAGRNGAGRIGVYDDRRLVVRVTGSIGYDQDPTDPSYIKFKIGLYQDYMLGDHVMDIDWVLVEAMP